MSELLSQCLPNCSVKLLAGGGEPSREGDTERASREEEKVHMAQAAALSTHAALQPLAGQPHGAFSPTGRGCCQTAFQKASPAAAPCCWWPRGPPASTSALPHSQSLQHAAP